MKAVADVAVDNTVTCKDIGASTGRLCSLTHSPRVHAFSCAQQWSGFVAKMWFSFATYLLERVGGVEIILSGDPLPYGEVLDFLTLAPFCTMPLFSPILVIIAHISLYVRA